MLSLREDFSPRAFGEALAHAEKETLDALILDSASHEWDAVGGVRHMAAMNEEAGKKGMLVWQTPKMDHQRHFMLPLLSTPIPLVILCMRARYPMEENKAKKGDWFRAEHLVPYQSDTILFEMFAHGWIDRAHCFHGTKYTREELRQVIRENEPISLETGQRLAAWAKGGTTGAKTVAVEEAQPSARAPLVGDAGVPFDSATGAYRDTPRPLHPSVPPTEAEMIAGDFAARFDEVATVTEGKDWAARWETARATIPAALQVPVQAALNRARARVKGKA